MDVEAMVSLASVIAATAAVVAVVFMWVQLRREIAKHEEMEDIVLAREPRVEWLTPIVLPAEESFRVIVPIRNSSMSDLASAHRVQVTFTFGRDNVISEIDPGPFRVIGGGKDKYNVTFEANVLPPLSVNYPSVIVKKKETPEVSIGVAEKTGWQNVPLKG